MFNKLKNFFLELRYFFTSMVFWKNCGGILATLIGLLLFTSWWLKCYTNHGESLEVHKYIGLNVTDAIEKAEERSFNIVVSDSVFRQGVRGGTVIDQNPKPKSRVKENRTIYLTIAAYQGELKTVECFSGRDDYEQYTRVLQSRGLLYYTFEKRYDPKVEENTILGVIYHGKDISTVICNTDPERPFQIPRGDSLGLIVSQRQSTEMTVPDLVCMTFDEATFLISTNNLNVGNINKDNTVNNESTAIVYKQEPAAGMPLRMGELINLYLTQKNPDACGGEQDDAGN